jgi:hypothetical protein
MFGKNNNFENKKIDNQVEGKETKRPSANGYTACGPTPPAAGNDTNGSRLVA